MKLREDYAKIEAEQLRLNEEKTKLENDHADGKFTALNRKIDDYNNDLAEPD